MHTNRHHFENGQNGFSESQNAKIRRELELEKIMFLYFPYCLVESKNVFYLAPPLPQFEVDNRVDFFLLVFVSSIGSERHSLELSGLVKFRSLLSCSSETNYFKAKLYNMQNISTYHIFQ